MCTVHRQLTIECVFYSTHPQPPPIAFSQRMSANTSQPGKTLFSMLFSCHQLITASGQWGYVGKVPPRTSTSHSASWASSIASRETPSTSQSPLTTTMPPRARPVSRPPQASEPPKASEPPQASSQPSPDIVLPTTFRFLRRDTVTPATMTSVPAPAKPAPTPPPAPEFCPVHF